MKPDAAAFGSAVKQQAKAHSLADNGSQRRAGNTHVAHEDQNGIQDHVDHRAGNQARHGIDRIALIAQLVVKHQ